MRRHVPAVLLTVVVAALVFGTTGVAQKATARPGNGIDTKARQVRPIDLGTSGGNVFDLANGFCCSGTLGALVQDNSNLYILSNTHVFAGDSVSGGNNRTAQVGDPVNQPGLIDVGCQNLSADYVASVSDWSRLGTDNVDASIAQITSGRVDTSGAILGIGTLSSAPASAFVGQAVKKVGRTSGLTRSSVSALNATVNVGYSNECAGESFTAQFTGQVMIENRGSKFLKGGDSGSLMVEDVAANPRAVGLLYAGSNSIAVANPIQDVLAKFHVSMVGSAAAGSAAAEDKHAGARAQGLARAMAVQERRGHELDNIPGFVGHGIAPDGVPTIKVFVETLTQEARDAAPASLDGVRVVLEETGPIRAMIKCAKAKK